MRIVLAFFLSIIVFTEVFSQKIQVTLSDSFFIPTPNLTRKHYAFRTVPFLNHFVVVDRVKKGAITLRNYTYRGEVQKTVDFPIDTTSYVLLSLIKGDTCFGFTEDYIFFHFLSQHLDSLKSIEIPMEFSDKYSLNFYGFYDVKNIVFKDFIVVPLAPQNDFTKGYRKWEYAAGVFKLKGNNYYPYMLLGHIDSLMKKRKAFFLCEYPQYAMDIPNNRVLFSLPGTERIQVWQIDSSVYNPVQTFGSKGTHTVKNSLQKQKFKDMFHKRFSNYFRYRIENNLYEDIFYDSTHKLVFRGYTSAIKDTVYNHKKLKKNDTRINVLLQIRLEQSKPYGLQIYNEKYELIYDEVMPTPFNILKIQGNEIWVHGKYDEKNQKYWIYQYKLSLPQP